jgi:hypothetical protein
MGFARWAMMTPASQGRLIFAALAPIFIAISAGLAALGRRVLLAGNLLMAAAAIITPWAYIKPAYEPPLLVAPPSDIVIINQPLQPYAEVIGYTMTPAQAQPGQRARVSVYLRALKTPSKNFYLVTKLFGKRAQPLGRFDSYTGSGLFLSKDWKPGDIWKDEAEFTIPLDAETPATLKTAFVLFHPYSGETSVTTDSSGKSMSRCTLAQPYCPCHRQRRLRTRPNMATSPLWKAWAGKMRNLAHLYQSRCAGEFYHPHLQTILFLPTCWRANRLWRRQMGCQMAASFPPRDGARAWYSPKPACLTFQPNCPQIRLNSRWGYMTRQAGRDCPPKTQTGSACWMTR